MWFVTIVLVATASFVPAEVVKDGVRVRVSIRSHVYTWEVTNLEAPPIMRFEVAPFHSYDFLAPDGWTVERDNREVFLAWTEDADRGIRSKQSKTFSARVSSQGAVLGQLPLSLGFGSDNSAEPITFEAVWGPVKKSRSMVALIAASLIILAVVHALVLWRRSPPGSLPAGPGHPPSSGSAG